MSYYQELVVTFKEPKDHTSAPSFDREQIEAMRNRLPEYLTQTGLNLRKKGDRLVCRCPRHEDSNPSFAVFADGKACGCHPCDFKGDVFAVSQWMGRSSSFPEAVADVATTLGVRPPQGPEQSPPRQRQAQPRRTREPEPPFVLSDSDRERIQSARLAFDDAFDGGDQIVDDIAESLGLDWDTLRMADSGECGLALSKGWLAYGYPTGLKIRNRDPKAEPRFYWPTGKATAPWRWERAIKPEIEIVYLTEGESDTLALLQAGLEDDGTAACVSLPGKEIPSAWVPLFAGRKVVLCLDSDVPGQTATAKVAAMLKGTAADVLTLDWREAVGAKDCRDVLQKHGSDELRRLVLGAVAFNHHSEPPQVAYEDPLPDITLAEPPVDNDPLPDSKSNRKPLSFYKVNHSETLGASWQEIDALRPPFVIDNFLRQGELLLLGAESKSRKSWLAQDAGFSVAVGIPWLMDEDGEGGFATAQARVHVFDLELNQSEMRYRFAKARANRFTDPAMQKRLTDAVSAYSLDGLNVASIEPLLSELKATVRPGDLVIVDCFYRLVPDGNETKEVAGMLEFLKRFASDTQAGVILVDHFRKAGDDKARNRFAGSFVKQASAATLVAIEVTGDDMLVMSIDARTFHGCPKVHARFDSTSYTFERIPEADIRAAKDGADKAEAEGWLNYLWGSRAWDASVTSTDAGLKWALSRQAATPRLGKLVARGWLAENSKAPGKATEWTITSVGKELVMASKGRTA